MSNWGREVRMMIALVIGVGVVYVLTLSPGIGVEDAGELTTAAATLGIAHPPGFPLYVIVGWGFSHLPFSTPALAMNAFSAFWGALAVGVLYAVLRAFGVRSWIAVAIAATFGGTHLFWSQSVVAEVYTLSVFFLGLVVLFLHQWIATGKQRWFFALAGTYGLSLANHLYFMLVLLPIIVVALLWHENAFPKRRAPVLLPALGLFLLGLSVYLYLPLRSFADPALDWGNPEGITAFIDHVSRQDYNDLELATSDPEGRYQLLGSFLEGIWDQYGILLVGIGVIGLWWEFRRGRKLSVLLFLAIVLNTLAVLFLRDRPADLGTAFIYRVYHLPSYFLFAIFIGRGFEVLWHFLGSFFSQHLVPRVRSFATISLVLLVLLIPAIMVRANWDRTAQHTVTYPNEYPVQLLNSLDSDAVLVVKERGLQLDSTIFGLMYAQGILGLRPDVTIVTLVQSPRFFPQIAKDYTFPDNYFALPFTEQARELLAYAQATHDESRPFYTTFTTDFPGAEEDRWTFRSNGMVYRVFSDPAAAEEWSSTVERIRIESLEHQHAAPNYYQRELLSKYWYVQAAYFEERGARDQIGHAISNAILFDNRPFSDSYQEFIRHRSALIDERRAP